MLPSLLHMGFDNHYNCVDEHDYNQRMQILLPFETIRMIRCPRVLAMGALILVQHFFGDHSFDGETFLPKESFYNGEAAYLLNQSSATWGQNLSSENSLPNPCASDKYKVYKGCTGYTNDASEAHHNVKNGFCTNAGCDYYEKPHYNETDGVYEISNAGQLYAYADNAQTVYTKGARLTADIVVNEGTLIQEDGTPVAKTDDIRMWDEVFRTSGYPYNNQKLVFDGNAGGIVAGFPIGPADYKVVFVGVFTVCFGILSTARVKKREVFLLRSKVLFANSLCYFNTCVFPMYFPIVSPCC